MARLKEALKIESEAVNLEDANGINSAIKYFEANTPVPPAPDVVQKRNRIPKSLIGKWSGNWGTTGNPFKFDLSARGDLLDGNVTTRNNRLMLLDARSQIVELVPYNGGLLVLGYSRSKNLHPEKSLPDHVGFAARTK